VTEVTEANQPSYQPRERHGMGGSEGRVAAWVVVRAGTRAEVRVVAVKAAVAMVRSVEETEGSVKERVGARRDGWRRRV